MRARRAATCLAVARSAVASGKIPEAIDRLEEACTLDPDAAEARLLLEELRSHETSAEVAAAQTRPRTEMAGWSHWVAAAIAICALAALAVFWPMGPAGSNGSVEPSREEPSAPSAPPPPAATGLAPEAGLAAQLGVGEGSSAGSAAPPVGTAGAGSLDRGDASSRRAGNDSVGIRLTEQPVVQRPLPIVPSGEQAAETDRRGIRARA